MGNSQPKSALDAWNNQCRPIEVSQGVIHDVISAEYVAPSEQELSRPYTDQIWEVTHLLTDKECKDLIKRTEKIGYSEAGLSTASGQKMVKEIRNNYRCTLEDQEAADRIFRRVKNLVPAVINGMIAYGLNERWRFYRYDPGEKFAPHIDGAFVRNPGDRSFVTFQIYLNGGYVGGSTKFFSSVFPNGEYDTIPGPGKGLFFYHKDWVHQGTEVEQGRKYSIRSDIMYRRIPQATLELMVARPEQTLAELGVCFKCKEQVHIVRSEQCEHLTLKCGCAESIHRCGDCGSSAKEYTEVV